MAISKKEIFIDGIWGPYYSAMFPSLWTSEGGQSATGKLLDHIIDTHPATSLIRSKLEPKMLLIFFIFIQTFLQTFSIPYIFSLFFRHIQQYLYDLIRSISKKENLLNESYLTKDLHVWPDFHGNRSPLADPSLRGMVIIFVFVCKFSFICL